MSLLQTDLQTFVEFRLPRWQDLPEYELYNEQLVVYVCQTLSPLLQEARPLTQTMIQNYVKWKALPRPEGKKYGRVHIAWCIVITLLKKVLTIPDIERGIQLQIRLEALDQAYDRFCTALEWALQSSFSPVLEGAQTYVFEGFETPAEAVATRSVCQALAYKLLTERVLQCEGFALNHARFKQAQGEEIRT